MFRTVFDLNKMFFVFLFGFFALSGTAQQSFNIKGQVSDSVEKKSYKTLLSIF